MSDDIARDEILVDKPEPTDQQLWSVTTIIDQSSGNQGLVEWAAQQTAKAALTGRKTIDAMLEEDGEHAAYKWLCQARYRPPKGRERTSKELGTLVHRACETYVLTGQKPEVDSEVQPFLDRFDEWCEAFRPEYEAAEMTVYHPDMGYAGTLDAILKVGGARVVGDYKTSRDNLNSKGDLKRPWSDVALQLAAYRHARFAAAWRPRRFEVYRRRYYLLGSDERSAAVRIPEVDGGLCIYITPERCEAYPVRCDDEVFEQYAFTVARSKWALELAKQALGDPIKAPQEVAA